MREFVDKDAVVTLASELVAVDTRNPPGNEAPIEPVVREALERQGTKVDWTRIEPSPGRVSLVGRLDHPDGPDPTRKTLLINGHLDVVPVDERAWTRSAFAPTVESGRLYGRGTADMKGGIAAAVCALGVLERAGTQRGCDLAFHFVADEERGGALGTGALLDSGLVAGDACLIPEPTGLAMCVAERGLLQAYVHVRGTPGHGSRPKDGVSAIEHAARIVIGLHGADFDDPDHPLLGRPSANAGTISGGNAFNTIAESATIGLDRRLLPGATADSAIGVIRSRIDALGIEDLHYEVELDTFGEASEMDPDHAFVKLLGGAIGSVTGSAPETLGMSFTTDARFVRNQLGIPTVVCGPGEVAQAHAIDEYVEIDQLLDATAAFAELIASYG